MADVTLRVECRDCAGAGCDACAGRGMYQPDYAAIDADVRVRVLCRHCNGAGCVDCAQSGRLEVWWPLHALVAFNRQLVESVFEAARGHAQSAASEPHAAVAPPADPPPTQRPES